MGRPCVRCPHIIFIFIFYHKPVTAFALTTVQVHVSTCTYMYLPCFHFNFLCNFYYVFHFLSVCIRCVCSTLNKRFLSFFLYKWIIEYASLRYRSKFLNLPISMFGTTRLKNHRPWPCSTRPDIGLVPVGPSTQTSIGKVTESIYKRNAGQTLNFAYHCGSWIFGQRNMLLFSLFIKIRPSFFLECVWAWTFNPTSGISQSKRAALHPILKLCLTSQDWN